MNYSLHLKYFVLSRYSPSILNSNGDVDKAHSIQRVCLYVLDLPKEKKEGRN